MKNSLTLIIFLILFTLSSLGFAEGSPPTTSKLGFITVLSGEYSDVGKATANGAQLAVDDFNSTHPKEHIQLILEDDGGDAKKALSAFQKLRSVDKASIILPVSTFAIGPIRHTLNREKRLTFILGNEPYEPEDDFIYMLSPAAIPADRAFGKHIAEQNSQGKIIIISSENQAVMRFAKALKEGAGARAEIVEIPASLTDYSSLVVSIKSKKPAAMAFVSLPRESARVLKSMQDLNFTSKLYFDESIINSLSDVRAILGSLSVLENTEMLKLSAHTDPTFAERYSQAFGNGPRMWADYSYDAVCLALKLRAMASEEARNWLAKNSYAGVSGSIEFDQLGLRKPEFSIVRLNKDGGIKP